MDDGDVRPASALFALKGRAVAVARPRLAWSPWARGLALGVALGLIVGMALGALAVMRVIESHLENMERHLTREVIGHGGG